MCVQTSELKSIHIRLALEIITIPYELLGQFLLFWNWSNHRSLCVLLKYEYQNQNKLCCHKQTIQPVQCLWSNKTHQINAQDPECIDLTTNFILVFS